MKTRTSFLWLLLVGSVSLAANAALYDPSIELLGAAQNIVFADRWFLPVLGMLAACTLYIGCICLLGRAIGINELDRDQDRRKSQR